MKLLSTNISEVRTISWKGKIIETGIYKLPIKEPIFLGKEGVKNDNVIEQCHGGVDKACYLYSKDHYSFWKRLYPDLDWNWGMFGENLTVEGLDESKVNIGDTFEIGEAIVQASEPRAPCFKLGIKFGSQSIIKEFLNLPYTGVYIRIIKEGLVKNNDSVILKEKAKDSLSLSEVFSLYTGSENIELIKKAIAIPQLSQGYKRHLSKYIE